MRDTDILTRNVSCLSAVTDTLERRTGVQMSPVQWHTHIELLQSFSQAAEKASAGREEVHVGGHSSAVLVAGTQTLTLSCPTVITIPDTDAGSDVTVKPACSISPGQGLPSAIAPHELKSTDSFYSLTEEMDSMVHEVANVAAVKNDPSPIPEEDHGQRTASPR
jgi:hypothetical protein